MADEIDPEQLKTAEKRPLDQRVAEFLTTFAQEKQRQPAPPGKETLMMAQTAACYRLAAKIAEGKLTYVETLDGVKKYGKDYHLALSQKRQEAQGVLVKNPTKNVYEKLKATDPQTLDALLTKAEFLNKRGSLRDPNKETDPAKKKKIESDFRFTTETFGKKLARPVGELANLFVCSRQKRRLEQLDGELKTMGETLEELGKIVPKKATP